jgi:hypothetical protein
MKEESKDGKPIFQKFCGAEDKVRAAKPCANCTCGLREYFDFKY